MREGEIGETEGTCMFLEPSADVIVAAREQGDFIAGYPTKSKNCKPACGRGSKCFSILSIQH